MSSRPFWATDNTIVVAPSGEVDQRFLYGVLKVARLNDLSGGAAQPVISQSRLKAVSFRLPPYGLQRRIAAVLSAFDELIEINERRIEMLEDLARSLYREWFVHFRFPGHEDVEFIDSELGPIPEGWATDRLGAVAEFIGGRSTTKSSYVPQGFHAYSAAGQDGYLPTYDVDGDGVVLSAVGARCGRTFRASGRWSAIANTIRFVPVGGRCSAAWLYYVTANPGIWPKRGSAQPFISINDARGIDVIVPPSDLAATFQRAASPFLSLVDELIRANEKLGETRNLLLPRLVTGRLDISELDLGTLTPMEVE